jgi:Fe-Mn family superoxide dismutase
MTMQIKLPKLSYKYDALEPYIDAKTMEIHYSKHHQGYVDKSNAILERYPNLADKKLEDILSDIDSFNLKPVDRQALINNGGGVVNHSLFWQIMGSKKEVDEKLVKEIERDWGDLDKFKQEFSAAALGRFGSGWAWLVRGENDKLQIYSLPNQDSPLSKGHQPIFNLDVWEHAYYLKYQNRRAEYIENWWHVLRLIP